jgi:uncharacterized protein YbjT (DUF2867 family)
VRTVSIAAILWFLSTLSSSPVRIPEPEMEASVAQDKVLVLGAYGFIGAAIARALLAAGHAVRGLGRDLDHGRRVLPGLDWVAGEMRRMTAPGDWAGALDGVGAVVNAAGALQGGPRDDLAAVHDHAIRALLEAARAGGVRRVVQISAAGVAPGASTEFFRSKSRGDAAVRVSGLDWVILRPGLVIGREAYGGTALIRALAAVPGVQPMAYPQAPVQTVALADVARAAVAAVEGRVPPGTEADLVTPEPLPLAAVVAAHRAWLGLPRARAVAVPGRTARLAAAGADALGRLGWRSPLRSTAMTVLADGVRGDPGPWRELTGETLPGLADTLAVMPATAAERRAAKLYFAMPVAVAVLAVFWIASGLIGLWRTEAAAAVLAPAGIGPDPAVALVWLGALTDVGLGLAVLVRRWARAACLGMAIVSLGYLALTTLLTPWLWADPLGPLVKVVPGIVLALVTRTLLEAR